jgi:hypothetical protein
MKKILFIICLLVVAVSLLACSSTVSDDSLLEEDFTDQAEVIAPLPVDPRVVVSDYLTSFKPYTVSFKESASYLGGERVSYTTVSDDGVNRRVDFETASRLENEKRTYISLADDYYSCSVIAGNWRCFSTYYDESDKSFTLFKRLSAIASEFADYDVSLLPSRTIANKSASCYLLEHSLRSESICLYDGILVYYSSGSTDSKQEIVALDVSSSVAQGVFSLPHNPNV